MIDPDIATSLTAGGILCILVLQVVFNFLGKRNGNGNNVATCDTTCKDEISALRQTLRPVTEQLHDLWTWHNKEDVDGVKLWYVRRSLEVAITELTESIRMQTDVMTELVRNIKEDRKSIEELQRQVRELSKQRNGQR